MNDAVLLRFIQLFVTALCAERWRRGERLTDTMVFPMEDFVAAIQASWSDNEVARRFQLYPSVTGTYCPDLHRGLAVACAAGLLSRVSPSNPVRYAVLLSGREREALTADPLYAEVEAIARLFLAPKNAVQAFRERLAAAPMIAEGPSVVPARPEEHDADFEHITRLLDADAAPSTTERTPETMTTMKLNPEQRLALASLEWFATREKVHSGPKGRTTVMALAILRAAVRNEGTSQPLIDNNGGAIGERVMRDVMRSMLDMTRLAPYAELTAHSVVIRRPDPQHLSDCDTDERLVQYEARVQALLAL